MIKYVFYFCVFLAFSCAPNNGDIRFKNEKYSIENEKYIGIYIQESRKKEIKGMDAQLFETFINKLIEELKNDNSKNKYCLIKPENKDELSKKFIDSLTGAQSLMLNPKFDVSVPTGLECMGGGKADYLLIIDDANFGDVDMAWKSESILDPNNPTSLKPVGNLTRDYKSSLEIKILFWDCLNSNPLSFGIIGVSGSSFEDAGNRKKSFFKENEDIGDGVSNDAKSISKVINEKMLKIKRL